MKKKLFLFGITFSMITIMLLIITQPANAKTNPIQKDGFTNTYKIVENPKQVNKSNEITTPIEEKKPIVTTNTSGNTPSNDQVVQTETIQQTQVQPIVNANINCNGSGNCDGINCQSLNCPYKTQVNNNQNTNYNHPHNQNGHHGGGNNRHGGH